MHIIVLHGVVELTVFDEQLPPVQILLRESDGLLFDLFCCKINVSETRKRVNIYFILLLKWNPGFQYARERHNSLTPGFHFSCLSHR